MDRFTQGVDYKKIDHEKYKYEMIRDRVVLTSHIGLRVCKEFYSINVYGLKEIKKGYRCDGPSGWTIDTPSFMRSAFNHDIDWQIARLGEIPHRSRDTFFVNSNLDLRRLCIEDGMMWPRYNWVHYAVSTDVARKNFALV